jgi:prepilin-type N-terminal cleavage/methylation domain-containing protein
MLRIKSNRNHKIEAQKPEDKNMPSAFTLIELLLVSSIAAIMTLAIFSTFSIGIKAYERLQYSGLIQADVLLSLDKIEKDLHNTVNFSDIDFAGENKSVSFASLATSPVSSDETLSLGRISYYFDTKNKSLIREENVYTGIFSKTKVLAYIEDLTFTYYYFNSQTQQYIWVDSWQSVNGIPEAVRIKAIFKNENNKDVEITRTMVIPVSG